MECFSVPIYYFILLFSWGICFQIITPKDIYVKYVIYVHKFLKLIGSYI